jgi:hypothetical protein
MKGRNATDQPKSVKRRQAENLPVKLEGQQHFHDLRNAAN